jgi:hypothetical protein
VFDIGGEERAMQADLTLLPRDAGVSIWKKRSAT